MRAAPALFVTVRRFDAWRIFVALVCSVAAASFAAWLVLHAQFGAPGPSAGAAAAAAALVSWFVSRREPVSLRWDGLRWHLGPARAAPDALIPGRVLAAVDAGAFLLLRFKPESGAKTQWLPVQRAGLEASWPALRRAVYSPRPAASEPTDDPLSPA